MDFVTDKLSDGRVFRILTVVDQFTRECVWLEADRSMNGKKVAQALTKAAAERHGFPESITCDNGSEFASRIVEAWALGHRFGCVSSDQAGRWRTGLQKALTVDSAMSFSILVGFYR
jgi:transposase InsO family protein